MKKHSDPDAPLTAKAGDTARVHYSCRLEDGSVFATTEGKEPKEILIGTSQVIPGLQEALIGMSAGEQKIVTIPPEQAYGPYHEEMTATLDRSMVPADLKIEVGVAIKVKHEDGHESDVFVTKIGDDTIDVDGNHPLAGKRLTMVVELVEIIPG